MSFPTTGSSSPALAAAVTDRIWACVRLQWDWLGGVRATDEPAAAVATRTNRWRRESALATHPARERTSGGSGDGAREETRAA
jgi:hypothetical protein